MSLLYMEGLRGKGLKGDGPRQRLPPHDLCVGTWCLRLRSVAVSSEFILQRPKSIARPCFRPVHRHGE